MKTHILFGYVAGAASILAFASPSLADDTYVAPPQTTTTTTQTTAAPVTDAEPAPIAPAPTQTTATTTTTSADMRLNETAPPADTVTLYRETRPNRKLLIPGVALLGVTYGATAATAFFGNGREADDNLYIPVVGPWMNLADRQCEGCNGESLNKAMIIGSGVLQGAGALMTVASFIIPEKTEAVRIQAGSVNMQLTPTMARGAAGFGAVGTF